MFITTLQILEDSRIARQQLSEIESRHQEVLKVEKSIVEIRDIFREMAFMIEKQVCRYVFNLTITTKLGKVLVK